jgi:hypothetical protein
VSTLRFQSWQGPALVQEFEESSPWGKVEAVRGQRYSGFQENQDGGSVARIPPRHPRVERQRKQSKGSAKVATAPPIEPNSFFTKRLR